MNTFEHKLSKVTIHELSQGEKFKRVFSYFSTFLKWYYMYITGMNLGLIQNKLWQTWITIYLFICTFLSDKKIVGFRAFMFDVIHVENLWSIFPADLEANRLQRKNKKLDGSEASRRARFGPTHFYVQSALRLIKMW